MKQLKNYLFAGLFALSTGLASIPASAAEIKIKGKTLDSVSKEVLESVTVKARFKNNLESIIDSTLTKTNDSGEFEIRIPEGYDSIDFSFSHIGYSPRMLENVLIGDFDNFSVQLTPSATEVSGMQVTSEPFHKLSNVNPKKEIVFDDNLNEVIKKEYDNFDINDVGDILKNEVSSINKPQSEQLSSTLHIQGYVATTFLDGVPLVNDSKLGFLGGTSVYTFDRITTYENYTPDGGFPGSIHIDSKNRPAIGKNSTRVYFNPVIREVYTEKKIGDSTFVFIDAFVTDNRILKYMTDKVKAPNFSGLEAKVVKWKNRNELSFYGLLSRGIVDEESTKSGVELNTSDNIVIFNFGAQPKSFLGIVEYPKFEAKLAYQNSSVRVATRTKEIDIGLKRNRINAKLDGRFFLPLGVLKAQVGFQMDNMRLFGDMLKKTDVGNGGNSFTQSFRALELGVTETFFHQYIGLEKDNLSFNLKHKFTPREDTWAYWAAGKSEIFGVPVVAGVGYVQEVQSNMNFLNNRFVIEKDTDIKKEQVWYGTLKGTKEFENKIRIDGGVYMNWSLTNGLREADMGEVSDNINEGFAQAEDTLSFLESLQEYDNFIPEPTFHLLKGGRFGVRLKVKAPINSSIDLTGEMRYENAYTYIPSWNYLHAEQDSVYYTSYEGAKVSNYNSNGLSWKVKTGVDIAKLFGLNKQLNGTFCLKYSAGRTYSPILLDPISGETGDGTDVEITQDNKPIYLKQTDRGRNFRYPGNYDMDLRFDFQVRKNLRTFVFVDNLLNNSRVISRVYETKYGVFSDGRSWENKDNYRFIGFGFEWKPGF